MFSCLLCIAAILQQSSQSNYVVLTIAETNEIVCFQVSGMNVVEEWMLWADEKTVNFNYQRGTHPTVERDRRHNTKLFYCYYSRTADEIDSMLYI